MPGFELPEEDISSLLQFAKFQPTQKETIISIIENYKKSQPFKSITQEIVDKLNIEFEEVENFVNTYTTLLRTKLSYDFSDENLLTYIIEGVKETEEYEENDIELIKDWTFKLLSLSNKDPLITTLGYQMAALNNNLYYESEIFEELRPVFFNNNFAGLALYHTLKIHYELPDKRHSDLYFSLDNGDIDKLISLLTKAKNKAELLKEQYIKDIIEI